MTDVTCSYCNNTIHIEWAKKAPANHVDPRTLYVSPQSSVPALIIAGATVAMLSIGGVVFSVLASGASSGAASSVQGIAQAVGGGSVSDFPVTCGLNGQLRIEGQTYEGKGPLIIGNINCKISIKDSKLKSDVIVEAKNLTEVTIENSTLEASVVAINMEMNATVNAKAKSVIKGKEAAVKSGPNGKLNLTNSTVSGDEVAVDAGLNFKLDARGSKLKGTRAAIIGKNNLDVASRDSDFEGKRVAIEADTNLALEMRGGSAKADEAAVRAPGYNAKVDLSEGAKLEAKETALDTGGNLVLTLEGSQIKGGEHGIATKNNAKLNLRDKAVISGGQVAVKADSNAEISMRGSRITSSNTALCGAHNAQIEARKSTIEGKTALSFARKPRKLDLVETSPKGRQDFRASGCD